jgi:predicted DNA-binding transcriptional regulator AlpA
MNERPTAVPPPQDLASITLLDVKKVAAALGVHRRTVWALASQGLAGLNTFPQPVHLSPRVVRWRAVDLAEYIAGLKAGGPKP